MTTIFEKKLFNSINNIDEYEVVFRIYLKNMFNINLESKEELVLFLKRLLPKFKKSLDKSDYIFNLLPNKIKNDLNNMLSNNKYIKMLDYFIKLVTPTKKEQKSRAEVFTPLSLVNEMLDKLPKDVWINPNLKWLDPANGIGNFPVCIYLKLMESLKDYNNEEEGLDLRDEESRRKHILENMIYVCELDKKNCLLYKILLGHQGKYKLNIFQGNSLKIDIESVWGIKKFDIVIGNPPYNKEGYDITFYDDFFFFYKDLCNVLSFVIPFRWTNGGRKKVQKMKTHIFSSNKLKLLNTTQDNVFKGTDIKGGICYFIYDNNYNGNTLYNNNMIDIKNGLYDECTSQILSKIKTTDKINSIIKNTICAIRKNLVVKNVVISNDKKSFVFCNKDYPIDDINFKLIKNKKGTEQVQLVNNKNGKYTVYTSSFASKTYYIKTNIDINNFTLDKFKNKQRVITMASSGSGKKEDKCYDNFGKTYLLDKMDFSTESYINIFVNNKTQGENLLKYLDTKFVLFLMRINKMTQQLVDKTLSLIPLVDLNQEWTDEKLYEHFNLDNKCIEYINSY